MPEEKLGIEIDAVVKELASLRELVSQLKKTQENAGIAREKMSQFQKQTEQLRSLRESFQSINVAGAEMMALSGGILYGFKKMATGFIDRASEMQDYELTLTTCLRDEKKAREELEWATHFADVTPYDIPEVIKADVTLRGFGLDARKYLGMAGDMAAVMNKDLGSATMGVAKAMASGPAAMDILTQSFGITGDAVRKFGWKGKKDIEGFRLALEKLLVSRFAGGMAEKSKTLKSYILGLRGEWELFQAAAGKPLIGTTKEPGVHNERY